MKRYHSKELGMVTIPEDDNGYVVGVTCDKGHSGNTRFVRDGAYCQCQGCGHHISAEYAQQQAKAQS